MIRVLVLALALIWLPNGARGQTPSAAEDVPAVLERYGAAWNSHSFDKLEGFWDTSDATPIYLAEEAPTAAMDWPAVRAYWRGAAKSIERIQVRYANIRIKRDGAEHATVVMDMRWDALWDGGRLTGGDNRVVATLRRTAEGWKFTSWVEAPLAPIVYIRRLYQNSVPPETAKALREGK